MMKNNFVKEMLETEPVMLACKKEAEESSFLGVPLVELGKEELLAVIGHFQRRSKAQKDFMGFIARRK